MLWLTIDFPILKFRATSKARLAPKAGALTHSGDKERSQLLKGPTGDFGPDGVAWADGCDSNVM